MMRPAAREGGVELPDGVSRATNARSPPSGPLARPAMTIDPSASEHERARRRRRRGAAPSRSRAAAARSRRGRTRDRAAPRLAEARDDDLLAGDAVVVVDAGVARDDDVAARRERDRGRAGAVGQRRLLVGVLLVDGVRRRRVAQRHAGGAEQPVGEAGRQDPRERPLIARDAGDDQRAVGLRRRPRPRAAATRRCRSCRRARRCRRTTDRPPRSRRSVPSARPRRPRRGGRRRRRCDRRARARSPPRARRGRTSRRPRSPDRPRRRRPPPACRRASSRSRRRPRSILPRAGSSRGRAGDGVDARREDREVRPRHEPEAREVAAGVHARAVGEQRPDVAAGRLRREQPHRRAGRRIDRRQAVAPAPADELEAPAEHELRGRQRERADVAVDRRVEAPCRACRCGRRA